ncbi:hypothetical protein M0D69_21870 [Caballeronia sp. SEWSISQ10-4 2]|nr:hypothetical protein [Caballeronia sp. SEWSISQ10-4 2]
MLNPVLRGWANYHSHEGGSSAAMRCYYPTRTIVTSSPERT